MENRTLLQMSAAGSSSSCSVRPEVGSPHGGASSSRRPSTAAAARAAQAGPGGETAELGCDGGRKENKGKKKPRFAFQTRSQVDVLDDGYKWRKYGQKAVKNNKFPRSYYRCSHHGCSVKKQVQRLNKDEATVVTTYDGTHTHPIAKPTDNFEQILTQMNIYSPI